MSTPWMKKTRKYAFAHKKGWIYHPSCFEKLIKIFTNFHKFNNHNSPSKPIMLLNNVFSKIYKTQLLQYALMLGNLPTHDVNSLDEKGKEMCICKEERGLNLSSILFLKAHYFFH
jgi:hypothetical protein